MSQREEESRAEERNRCWAGKQSGCSKLGGSGGSLDVILAGPPGEEAVTHLKRVQIPWLRLNDSVVFGLQPVPLKLYWRLLNVVSKILKCT